MSNENDNDKIENFIDGNLKNSDCDSIKENYIFEKDIGEGTFGKVKLATHILTKEKVLKFFLKIKLKLKILGSSKNFRER